MRTLRILFVSPAATRSGAPMLLLHLIRHLKQTTAHQLSAVLVGEGAMTCAFEAELPTQVFHRKQSTTLASRSFRRLPGMQARQRAAQVSRCRSVVSPWPPDLVFCNSASAATVLDALGPFDCPVVIYVHEMEYALASLARNFGAGVPMMERHAPHYIAGSRAVQNNLVQRHQIAAERISVVHDFISTDQFELQPPRTDADRARLATLGIPVDAAVVGAIATVEWRKGADLLVALASLMPPTDATGRPIHFVWVGGGYPDDVAQLKFDISTAAVGDRVHMAGPTDRTADWYPLFNVLMLASREDPFPLVALEAAASGLPIVCFADAGGMPEFVEADAGIVVPFLDLRALAEALGKLIGDPALAHQLGQRAAAKVRERHDASVAVPRLLQVIEQLTTAAPAGQH
jgi:glycosyltransferase involved in cell wall biosynthesis